MASRILSLEELEKAASFSWRRVHGCSGRAAEQETTCGIAPEREDRGVSVARRIDRCSGPAAPPMASRILSPEEVEKTAAFSWQRVDRCSGAAAEQQTQLWHPAS